MCLYRNRRSKIKVEVLQLAPVVSTIYFLIIPSQNMGTNSSFIRKDKHSPIEIRLPRVLLNKERANQSQAMQFVRHFLWHVSRQSGRNDHSCYPEGHNKREESWLSLSDSLRYWSTFLLRWQFDTIVLAKFIWPPSLQTDFLSHTYTHIYPPTFWNQKRDNSAL